MNEESYIGLICPLRNLACLEGKCALWVEGKCATALNDLADIAAAMARLERK